MLEPNSFVHNFFIWDWYPNIPTITRIDMDSLHSQGPIRVTYSHTGLGLD